MTSDSTSGAQLSTRQMTLVYFGFAREEGAPKLDAEMRGFIRTRRIVASLTIALMLYAVGSSFGVAAVAGVWAVAMLWFAVATQADRRRAARSGGEGPET